MWASVAVRKSGVVESLAVWRAAQDIIKRYPQEPELAACQIADDALAGGNVWEFKLWQSVVKAVWKLVARSPLEHSEQSSGGTDNGR